MAKYTGRERYTRKIRNIGPEAVKEVGKALFVSGQLVETDAAISITTGAVSGKVHVPSAPGEAPNADTHLLDRSIETNLVAPLKVEVSANAPYAHDLEYGNSKIEERPFMRPALAKNRDEINSNITGAVNRAIARAG